MTQPPGSPGGTLPSTSEARSGIARLKADLIARSEATTLFGNERDDSLIAVLGNLDQIVFGEPAYLATESKAAHPLHVMIKNHPLSDGNKLVGSYLFVDFLARNGHLQRNGEAVINAVGTSGLSVKST